MQKTAALPTARAPALLGTMAKHFGHKIPVELGKDRAILRFVMGEARLALGPDRLNLALEANDATALEHLREVVESHLMRFAHREEPAPLVWQPGA